MREGEFQCQCCGACCRIKDGIVRVNEAEIARIAAFFGTTAERFVADECEVAPDRKSLMLKSRADGACAWLTEGNLCRINAVKPDKCRTFPFEWTNPDSAEVCPALKRMQMIRGAIFDMDGLLFDTEIVFENSWKKVGAEMGLVVPDEFTHACCGCGRNGLPDVIRRFFPDADAPTYAERAVQLAFKTQLATVPVPKLGVREILAKCRAKGVRTAVASSSSRDVVEHNLSATGLTDSFDAIVTGSEVAHGKPAPDIFLLAAERIGIAPSDCAVFEDAVSGIRAAKAAGCLPVMIPDRVQPTVEILAICACRSSLLDALDLI